LLWALWVALVDFLPMVDGALAGIPTVLFALGHSLIAGIVTGAAAAALAVGIFGLLPAHGVRAAIAPANAGQTPPPFR
jgi:hypothetical protein